MRTLGSRLLDMEQRLESLVFKDSRARIVEFLKNLGERKGQRVGYETVVRTFMTHQEIANLTATSRQTVTTVLNELKNKNILTFNRRRLLIRDMNLLAKEANL
jgi:CRP-like cAMP-binding protein